MQATRRLAGLALVAAAAVALPITLAQPASAACAPGTYPPSSCAPTVVMTAPQTRFTLNSAHVAWRVQYSAGPIEKYQVRYARARWNGVTEPLVYPRVWNNLQTTAVSQTLPLGYTYCYSVRAVDTANRVGPWSDARCTARPLDDRSLALSSGWTRGSLSYFYMGTFSTTKARGARAVRTGANVRRIGVVGRTCPTCGKIGVFLGSTQIGTISFYSATTMNQQIKLLSPFVTHTGTTITLKNLSTKRVYIDGLGISRV
ncbi:MAG: hypothetical protein M3P04_07845 [Actinomycetota bacterium]|nr:hypothetical protein [Actinomycetota bacterium]